MLIARLVSLIEDHADELTARLVRRLREDPRTSEYRRLDEAELAGRVHDVFAHLGRWLERASEGRVEEEYFRLGNTRREEGIAPVSGRQCSPPDTSQPLGIRRFVRRRYDLGASPAVGSRVARGPVLRPSDLPHGEGLRVVSLILSATRGAAPPTPWLRRSALVIVPSNRRHTPEEHPDGALSVDLPSESLISGSPARPSDCPARTDHGRASPPPEASPRS